MQSTMIGSSSLALAVTLSFAVSACAPETSDNESTGQTEEAVSAFGIWSWGCGGTGACALDLGLVGNPSAGTARTCFLAGVWGNLQNNSVDVLKSGGHWGLQVFQHGHPLGGTAVCIASGTNVSTTTSWNSGSPSANVANGTTKRCFLGGIHNTNGFTATSDFVRVSKSGTSWTLSGTGGKTYSASATCVDVPTTTPERQITVLDGFSNKNSFVQSNNPGGWACGVTKIGGHFTADDFNDGAWIDFNNNDPSHPVWEQNGVNGKVIATTCVN